MRFEGHHPQGPKLPDEFLDECGYILPYYGHISFYYGHVCLTWPYYSQSFYDDTEYFRLAYSINRLANGSINGLVGQLAARQPQVAFPRRLPIG